MRIANHSAIVNSLRVAHLLREAFLDAAFLAYSWKLPAYSGAFLLTVDSLSFSLQLELFCLQFRLFSLQLELFCLQWESASNKGLKGL